MIKPSGRIFYKDTYDTLYRIEWDTVGSVIDFTTIIMQPYVWGKSPHGYIQNNVLFRLGVVTVQRQVLKIFDGGYEIVADGYSQYEDYIQMNFPCEIGPIDNFKYHLNCSMVDDIQGRITDGSRWADPDNLDDANVIWGNLDVDGNIVDSTITSGSDILEWTDVWSN